MSNPASERPLRQTTTQPFARLSRAPASNGADGQSSSAAAQPSNADPGLRQTGPRPRGTQTEPRITESSAQLASEPQLASPSVPQVPEAPQLPIAELLQDAAPEQRDSLRPDSLRKPYASLIPAKGAAAPATAPQPQVPAVSKAPSVPAAGGGWDDKSSNTQTGTRSKSSRAICPKHKIARNNQGVCMLCAREEKEKPAASKSGSAWTGPVLAMLAAVLVGALLAALL